MPAPSLHLPGMQPKELRPCDIKRIVAERQVGFRARQLEREAIRKQKRERRKKITPTRRTIKEMKCPIVFRADFEQPIGSRNPAKIKCPGAIPVEIFQKAVGPPAEWKARRPGSKTEMKWISAQSTPATIKQQIVGIHFERQLTGWEAFDEHGKLAYDEWSTDNQGKVFVTELRRARLAEENVHERAANAQKFGEEFERLPKVMKDEKIKPLPLTPRQCYRCDGTGLTCDTCGESQAVRCGCGNTFSACEDCGGTGK